MGRVRGVVGVKIDIISWGWRSEWLILARRGKKMVSKAWNLCQLQWENQERGET